MQSVVTVLSIGNLADRVARVVGWSPVGRKIVLHQAEGPHAGTFEGRCGKVLTVENGVLVVECGEAGGQAGSAKEIVRMTPRHVGWTARSLMICRIAVVAETSGRDGEIKQSIAIAAIK